MRLFATASSVVILGVSDAICMDIQKSLPFIAEKQIQTLYNRIPAEDFSAKLYDRREARRLLQLPIESKILVNIGRLHPDKDQKTLLSAFAKVLEQENKFLLVFIGSGIYSWYLKGRSA